MEVHGQLGHGFLEAVYHEALALELDTRQIPFQHEVALPIFYKGTRLVTSYRADFVCFDQVVVELKAISQLSGADEAQLLNYLKATQYEVGLLLNFGTKSLQFKRFANSR